MSGFAMLTDAVALLGVLLAQVLVAPLLRCVGLWLAAGAAVWVEGGGVPNATRLGQMARSAPTPGHVVLLRKIRDALAKR